MPLASRWVWLVTVKLPLRLRTPWASQVGDPLAASPPPGACRPAGGEVWLSVAVAAWNFVKLRATRRNEGKLTRPLLFSSASPTALWKSATAET